MAIQDISLFCLAFRDADLELALTALLVSAMSGEWTTVEDVKDYLRGDLHGGGWDRQKDCSLRPLCSFEFRPFLHFVPRGQIRFADLDGLAADDPSHVFCCNVFVEYYALDPAGCENYIKANLGTPISGDDDEDERRMRSRPAGRGWPPSWAWSTAACASSGSNKQNAFRL